MRTLCVGLLALVAASNAEAQNGKKRRMAADADRLVGTIKGMSDDGKLLMVVPDAAKRKNTRTLEVKVTSKTQIVIPKGRKQKLQVDDHVTIALDPKDPTTALGVRVETGSAEPPGKKKNKSDST